MFSSRAFLALATVASVSAQYYTGDGPYSGDGTYYATGLGACGITNTDADFIAAVGYLFFDNYPGATANPNLNPICGTKITATYNGLSVTVAITDRCAGCAGAWDLDFSPAAIAQIVPDYQTIGRVHGVSWVIDGGTVTTTSTTSTTTTSTSKTSTSTTSTTSTSSTSGGGSCAGVSAWSSADAYPGGSQVAYNGDLWTAAYWNEDEVPGGPAGVWADDGACTSGDALHPAVPTGSRFFKY